MNRGSSGPTESEGLEPLRVIRGDCLNLVDGLAGYEIGVAFNQSLNNLTAINLEVVLD